MSAAGPESNSVRRSGAADASSGSNSCRTIPYANSPSNSPPRAASTPIPAEPAIARASASRRVLPMPGTSLDDGEAAHHRSAPRRPAPSSAATWASRSKSNVASARRKDTSPAPSRPIRRTAQNLQFRGAFWGWPPTRGAPFRVQSPRRDDRVRPRRSRQVEVSHIDDATERARRLGAGVLLAPTCWPGRLAQRRRRARGRRVRVLAAQVPAAHSPTLGRR